VNSTTVAGSAVTRQRHLSDSRFVPARVGVFV